MSFGRNLVAAAAAVVLMTGAAQAATFNFQAAGGVQSGSGIGNSYTFSAGGGLTLNVTAWAATGPSGAFAPAQVYYDGLGLGVCNSGEGAGCSGTLRNADNNSPGGNLSELLLFRFIGPVELVSVARDPSDTGSVDTDLSYWVGSPSLPGDILGGETLASLDALFGQRTDVNGPSTSSTTTFNFPGGLIGNALLFGPEVDESNDYFRVENLVVNAVETSVPEPVSIGLLGFGLFGLGAAVRRRRKA